MNWSVSKCYTWKNEKLKTERVKMKIISLKRFHWGLEREMAGKNLLKNKNLCRTRNNRLSVTFIMNVLVSSSISFWHHLADDVIYGARDLKLRWSLFRDFVSLRSTRKQILTMRWFIDIRDFVRFFWLKISRDCGVSATYEAEFNPKEYLCEWYFSGFSIALEESLKFFLKEDQNRFTIDCFTLLRWL